MSSFQPLTHSWATLREEMAKPKFTFHRVVYMTDLVAELLLCEGEAGDLLPRRPGAPPARAA